MNSFLTITPNVVSEIAPVESARIARDEILHRSGLVTTVQDRIDYDDAMGVLKELKSFMAEIESQRETAKAPALELGRKIDGLAKELTSNCKTQADRIARLAGAFEAEERRKAEDARRQAEIDKAAIVAEALRKENAARKAAATAEAADRAADAIVETAQAQIVEATQRAINAAVPKTEGTRLRGNIAYEVMDIKALHAAHPELCIIEVNGPAVRAILRQNPNLQVPGLRHWIDHKVS